MNYQVTGDCDSVLVQQESSVYVNDHKLRAGLGLCIVCDNLDVFSAVEAGTSSRVCSRHIMAGKHRVYKL